MLHHKPFLEQRSSVRHTCDGSAALILQNHSGVIQARLRNISQDGVGVEIESIPNLTPGAKCEIRMQLSDTETGVIARKGTVVQYCAKMSNQGSTYAVGLRLEN